MKQNDVLVVGSGIVGLTTAYQLLLENAELHLTVLEKEMTVAIHQTGNNSGVIHSGIYYKPGSLKAKNCIEGYDSLIEFCKEQNIEFDLCGKIIVATKESELAALETLYQRGILNGLKGLKYLSSSEIKSYEPHCIGIKGIFVPQTGIVNYKQVCEKLRDLILLHENATIEFGFEVNHIQNNDDQVVVQSVRGGSVFGRFLVNMVSLCNQARELELKAVF